MYKGYKQLSGRRTISNGSKDRLSARQRRILGDIQATAREKGFREAWRTHLRSVIENFQEEHPSEGSVSDFLAEAMDADPHLRSRIEALPPQPAATLPAPREPSRASFERRAMSALDATEHAVVKESDGEPMRCFENRKFENWGQTVENEPSVTFVPRTKEGVCNLVKWAANEGKRVRAAGYRHTWTDLYSADDQVLVSMLEPSLVEDLPADEAPLDPENELQGIEIVHENHAAGFAHCRIGAATTNEMFRQWAAPSDKSEWKNWTVPLNVIMVEITYGGSNAPICHGAGLTTKTLSDLVVEIEFVNANGELQVVNNPTQLTVAAGCFGLLGIVTSITLRLDKMSYARMHPKAPHVQLAIPPPDPSRVPDDLKDDSITQAQRDAAWDEFVRSCENDYYVEWFWFPFQDKAWVNTWHNDGTKAEAKSHPNELVVELQEAMEFLAGVANDSLFSLPDPLGWLGRLQAETFGMTAMAALPKDQEIVAPLIDALHFQRGIHNMRVYDIELEIPIPPRADDPTKPDWTLCQKAWWDVIELVYERDDSPMRIALELRITHDSDMLMAPQHGNQFGTCSIEVLTTENVKEDDWQDFMQAVSDRWFAYQGPDGALLNVRPHWAKQWEGLEFRDQPAVEYLKQVAYADRLPEFKTRLGQIAAAGGFSLADVRARFSNPLLDDLFESVFV